MSHITLAACHLGVDPSLGPAPAWWPLPSSLRCWGCCSVFFFVCFAVFFVEKMYEKTYQLPTNITKYYKVLQGLPANMIYIYINYVTVIY